MILRHWCFVLSFFCSLFCFAQKSSSDTAKKVSSVALNEKQKNQRATYHDNGQISWTSSYNWAGQYRSRSYFENGKRAGKYKVGILTRRGMKWDEQGRRISKYKMSPSRSTSYTERLLEKKFDSSGHLIKKEYTKEYKSCFGGYTIGGYVVNYDAKGKFLSEIKKVRGSYYSAPTHIRNSQSKREVKDPKLKRGLLGEWTLVEFYDDDTLKTLTEVSDSTVQALSIQIKKNKIIERQFHPDYKPDKERYHYKLMTDSIKNEKKEYEQCLYFTLKTRGEEDSSYYLFGLIEMKDLDTIYIRDWGKLMVYKRKRK